jgi:hypothetical protein
MARGRAGKFSLPTGVSSVADELMAVPRNFMFGWLAGILIPVACLAGIVSGIYLLTQKIPFVTEVAEVEGRRRLTLELVEPEEARALFQRGREAAQALRDEIRSEVETEG